jgi:hypothetical protein
LTEMTSPMYFIRLDDILLVARCQTPWRSGAVILRASAHHNGHAVYATIAPRPPHRRHSGSRVSTRIHCHHYHPHIISEHADIEH